MRRENKFCTFLIALCGTVALPASTHAGITILKPGLNLFNTMIGGTCSFRIGKNDPYIAVNGPCVLERNGTSIASTENPRSVLPPPRETNLTLVSTGNIVNSAPIADAVYCHRFGENDANFTIVFGHQDPLGDNLEIAGDKTCKSATPQLKAYFQQFCLGSFVWVYSTYSLVPGVHLSYRVDSAPVICWAVATYPGEN